MTKMAMHKGDSLKGIETIVTDRDVTVPGVNWATGYLGPRESGENPRRGGGPLPGDGEALAMAVERI
jgi:hypothetical protein